MPKTKSKENDPKDNKKQMTLLERLMIATETSKTALLKTVNEISPHTLKKWEIERILAGEDEPLSLLQIKLIAVALGVDYQELISGAAGYTGIEIKEARQKIPNVYKKRRNKK